VNIQEVLKLHKEYLETNGVKGTKANLRGANLSWANLRGANLRGANLRGANLSWAGLSWANLRGADLSWADLSWTDLRGADLSGTDLREADLRWADLRGADLQYGNFHRWQYYATSETLRIGCEVHTWAEWKKGGKAIAIKHGCADEFKAFRPVLDATRKNLQARFPVKKEVQS